MNVLVINAGSSSLKYQLFDMDTEADIAKGICERIGLDGRLKHTPLNGKSEFKAELALPTHAEAINAVIEKLTSKDYGVIESLKEIGAVGHRVVHGGEKFSESALIDEAVSELLTEDELAEAETEETDEESTEEAADDEAAAEDEAADDEAEEVANEETSDEATESTDESTEEESVEGDDANGSETSQKVRECVRDILDWMSTTDAEGKEFGQGVAERYRNLRLAWQEDGKPWNKHDHQGKKADKTAEVEVEDEAAETDAVEESTEDEAVESEDESTEKSGDRDRTWTEDDESATKDWDRDGDRDRNGPNDRNGSNDRSRSGQQASWGDRSGGGSR